MSGLFSGQAGPCRTLKSKPTTPVYMPLLVVFGIVWNAKAFLTFNSPQATTILPFRLLHQISTYLTNETLAFAVIKLYESWDLEGKQELNWDETYTIGSSMKDIALILGLKLALYCCRFVIKTEERTLMMLYTMLYMTLRLWNLTELVIGSKRCNLWVRSWNRIWKLALSDR